MTEANLSPNRPFWNRLFRHPYLGPLDWTMMLLACVLTLAISLHLGAGKVMWEDEVLGWTLIRDPSWHHMFWAWQHGADGGGALFYLTARLWLHAFGASVTAFRLYSATCFSLAFCLVWIAARRFYPLRMVAASAAMTWFLSPELVPHVAEGRFYGLFMAAAAAAVLTQISASDRKDQSAELLICLFLSHSALVGSHLLGIAYSALLLLAFIALDRWRNLRRIRLYVAVLASWLWLVPSRSAIAASAAVGRPHFWTSQATPKTFLLAYTGSSLRTALILSGLIALCCAAALSPLRPANGRGEDWLKRLPILLICASLFLAPILFVIEGFLSWPIFNPRYLQPVQIGTLLLTAELLCQLHRTWSHARTAILFTAIAGGLMALQYDFAYLPRYTRLRPDYVSQLSQSLPAGVPVVCEDASTFTELMGRAPKSPVDYDFILDWRNSISASAPLLEVTQYHLMENWKNAGYHASRIAYRDPFMSTHPFFLLLKMQQAQQASLTRKAAEDARSAFVGNPLTARFGADSRYQELPFASQTQGELQTTETLVCDRATNCQSIRTKLRQSVGLHAQ